MKEKHTAKSQSWIGRVSGHSDSPDNSIGVLESGLPWDGASQWQTGQIPGLCHARALLEFSRGPGLGTGVDSEAAAGCRLPHFL